MQWKFLNWFYQTQHKPPPKETGKGLSHIIEGAKKIELVVRQKTESLLTSQYKSKFRGQGMQFANIHVYQYGDDVRHIDWRSSARSQQMYVKKFEEERDLEIICAVDISGSLSFGSQAMEKREVVTMALASIILSAAKNKDRISLMLFTDKVEDYLPPKKGRKHAMRIIEKLLHFQPKSKKTDLTLALQSLSATAKHRAVILLASDFSGPMNTTHLKHLAKKHDLIAMHVFDPRENSIPNVGLVQFQDLETGKNLLVDTSSPGFQKKFSEEQKLRMDTLRTCLQSSGATVMNLSTDKDPSEEVLRFFYQRRKYR